MKLNTHSMKDSTDAVTQRFPITRALEKVNGRAETHCYITYSDVACVAQAAEKNLDELNLPKKDRPGAYVISTSGGKVANAYSYPRRATKIRLQRGSTEWFLTSICAVEIWDAGGGRDDLRIDQDHADAIIAATFKKAGVTVIGVDT